MKGKLTRRSLLSQAGLADLDYASALNEFLMLGNAATRVKEQIDFDPLATKIVNNARADALLRSECRHGWSS